MALISVNNYYIIKALEYTILVLYNENDQIHLLACPVKSSSTDNPALVFYIVSRCKKWYRRLYVPTWVVSHSRS